jgi:hypothetical protein
MLYNNIHSVLYHILIHNLDIKYNNPNNSSNNTVVLLDTNNLLYLILYPVTINVMNL